MAEEARALEVMEREATLTVTKTAFGQSDQEQEKIRVRPFHKHGRVGAVTVGMGKTISLGNYEFARVDVSFNVPGYVEELKELYGEARQEVETRLTEEVRRIEGGLVAEADQEKPLEDIL